MKRVLISFFCLGILVVSLAGMASSHPSIWWDWRGLDGKDMLLKLVVSGVLTWLLVPQTARFNPWSPTFLLGITVGSIGLFFIRATHISGMVHWPFKFLGTAIPDLGSVLWTSAQLNPIFASVLIPIVLLSCLASSPHLKWFAFGIAIGMTSFFIVAAFSAPTVWPVGRSGWAMLFLLGNALVCGLTTRLFLQADIEAA